MRFPRAARSRRNAPSASTPSGIASQNLAASLPRTPWRNLAPQWSSQSLAAVSYPIASLRDEALLIRCHSRASLQGRVSRSPSHLLRRIHPRNALSAQVRAQQRSQRRRQECRRYKNPLAQAHPRKKTSGRGFRAFRVPTLPSGIPSVKDRKTSSQPFALLYLRNNASSWRTRLPRPAPPHRVDVSTIPRPSSGLVPIACPELRRAQPHPREPLVSGVLQSNVGTSYASLPFALLHPRNKQSGRARSAERSKTPARCRRYENPLLIVTPRLEIAATTSKSNTMQNSNRYKMRVLHPPWRMCVLPPPQTGALRRSANAAAAPHLKTLIANARLEFNLSHSKENPLQISNRERMTVSQSRFRAPAQEGRRITIRASKVKLRFESRYSSFQLRASSLQNLIANLELEFRLTHTKLSPLRISNRKYFAVFYADLLHRREKSGRPTTSDGGVVATSFSITSYESRVAMRWARRRVATQSRKRSMRARSRHIRVKNLRASRLAASWPKKVSMRHWM